MRLRVWSPSGKQVSKDLDRLYALDQACFHPGIAYTRAELAAFLSHPSAFSVLLESAPAGASQARELLGFSIGRTLRSRGRAVFHIITIDVDPTARRQGIGTSLIDWMAAKARELGVLILRLEVAVDNTEAIAFYRHIGFREIGRIPGYYPGAQGPQDALVLERELSPLQKREQS